MTSQLDLIDIQHRISSDFGDRTVEANNILKESIIKTDYLDHPRIIRCILFLAKGDIECLKKNIDAAVYRVRIDVAVQRGRAYFTIDRAADEFHTGGHAHSEVNLHVVVVNANCG